jgi:hypothetical protein
MQIRTFHWANWLSGSPLVEDFCNSIALFKSYLFPLLFIRELSYPLMNMWKLIIQKIFKRLENSERTFWASYLASETVG